MLRPRDYEIAEASGLQATPRPVIDAVFEDEIAPTPRTRYKPASLAIVRNGHDDVLSVRRPSPPYELVVPGGEVERGETAVEAALRELREETNVLGRAAQLIWASASPTDGRQVYVVFVGRWSGTPLPIEGPEVAWMKERDLVEQAGRYANFHRQMFKAERAARRTSQIRPSR